MGCYAPTGSDSSTVSSEPSPVLVVTQADAEVDLGTHFDIGSIQENTTRDVTFEIENRGDATLELTGVPAVELSDSIHDWFTIIALPETSLAPGGKTTFTIRFSPDAASDDSGTITVLTNAPGCPTFTLTIHGEATLTPVPEIAVSQGATLLPDGSGRIEFPPTVVSQDVNVYSSLTFTIANSGSGTLELGGSPRVAISGTGASSFSVPAQPSSSIGPGGTASFVVRFAPTSVGRKDAVITIQNNDSNEDPYTFGLSGMGALPEIAVREGTRTILDGTGSYAFGNVRLGSSAEVTLTILNSGNYPLSLTGSPKVAIGGSGAGHFSVPVQPSSSIAPSGNTSFVVRFTPTSPGSFQATVSIPNTDSNEDPYDFVISGSGTVPEMNVSGMMLNSIPDGTADLYLGESAYGSLHMAIVREFTIWNTGTATLNLTGSPVVQISGPNADRFTVTAVPTSTVSPLGGTTTFEISFQANISEMVYATVAISNDDPNENPYNFGISGDGKWYGLIAQ
jgi:hypothetical protein